MATTLQKPPHPSQMDPRLRRAVYAKYREMLVSKHNQANEMIKQLPAYMVREDRGFNTNIIVNDVPPPPPIPSSNIPAQRLQTQISEAPACVQNAMMTKDKKPFTYTPGGIDLSQIKSPRMAKRISANANSPGVTNTPKVSPLAQISNNGNSSPMNQTPQTPQSAGGPPPPPPMPPMGSLAMGMPFQVFPTGPAPPTKTQQMNNKPQTNGSPKKPQQSFEPPSMGCRPEIKIPENPMSALRKVPRPQQRDDYWIQEYVEEKARNSIPNEEDIRQYISSPTIQQYQQPEYVPPKPASPVIQQQKPSTPQSAVPQFMQKRSPSPPEQQQKEVNIPIQNLKIEENRSSSPSQRVQLNQSSPITQQQQQQQQTSSPVTVKNAIFEPIQQNNLSNKLSQNYQQPMQQQPQQSQGGGRIILSTMPKRIQQQQATQHLGSLYIPPPNIDDKQYLLNQQSPSWMSTKQAMETPEWVNRDEIDNFIQQTRSMHMMQQQPAQFSGPKEHVIPISMEKSPTRNPPTPNFGPTPFYGTPQHHINSVITPKIDPNANKFVNQGYNNIEFPQSPQRPYVQTQRQQQPTGTRIIPIQVEGARATQQNDNSIVMQSDPRSPASPRIAGGIQPTQSRSFKILQQVTGTMGDESDDNNNESKPKNKSDDDDAPMQEQKPIFSRPLGPNDMNESQLKRLQLSDSDRAFMNRVKSQVDEEIYLHSEADPRYRGSAIPSKAFKCLQKMTGESNSSNNCSSTQNLQAAPAGRQGQKNVQDEFFENQAREPGLYQGSAIPSRSFKILQGMMQPENADDNSNDNSDIEGNSYGNIGNNSYNHYHSCNSNPLNCQNCQNNHPNNNYHCTVPQTSQMYPQFMMPPQYAALYDWYDPQNNPWAAYYCPSGYDSNYFGQMPQYFPMPSHSRSQTPQPSQMSQQQPPPMPYFYPAYPPFFIMPPFMGFRPISASRETTPCFSEAERYQNMSTASDDRSRRAVSCTPTCCQHAKSFQVENLSNKFHTYEEPLTRSVSVQSDNPLINLNDPPETENLENQFVEYPLACDKNIRNSLKSIPSVGNLDLLDGNCNLEELKVHPIVTTCDEEDNASETSEDTTEVEEDISQDTETVELHFPHQLSVIYEENESAAANDRRSSICSRSSTLSDCSTTLMEEDNISIDEHSGDDLDEENSNSVTVRLPLKFSFTRSKDNMVNTTLTVGESESEFNESQDKMTEKEKSSSPMPNGNTLLHSLSNNSSANDVSVTFSLKSKSKSKTPERLVPPTLAAVECNSIEEIDDAECSVNISLPRRKSKSVESDGSRKRQRKDSENSELSQSINENSSENKVHIDNSLYTSLDALEEIKKGMAEITNSLFSKICTLRKSAINIPDQERNRSGSVSYIDSIESDEEDDDEAGELPSDQEDEKQLINLDENFTHNQDVDSQENADNISCESEEEEEQKIQDIPDFLQKVSENLQEYLLHPHEMSTIPEETSIDLKIFETDEQNEIDSKEVISAKLNPIEIVTESSSHEEKLNGNKEEEKEEEEEVDFWSQIASKNQDSDHTLSKTSTHSSRYWFEEDTDGVQTPPKDDGFAKYETNDVTTSVSFVSINDAATIENDENDNDDFDFWKDYDSDGDYGMKAGKFFKSQMKDDHDEDTNEDVNYYNDDVDATEVSIYEDPVTHFNEQDTSNSNDSYPQFAHEFTEENRQSTPESKNNSVEMTQNIAITSLKESDNEKIENLTVNQEIMETIETEQMESCEKNLTNTFTFEHRPAVKEIYSTDDQNEYLEENDEKIVKRPATPFSKTWENKSEFDDDSDTESCMAFDQKSVTKADDKTVVKVTESPVKEQLKIEQEFESDEEWTEEEVEVTDESENEDVVEKKDDLKVEIKQQGSKESDSESEYEEESEEEKEASEMPEKPTTPDDSIKINETNSSSSESEDESDSDIQQKVQQIKTTNSLIVESPSRIIKGKSLVNVNSFIQSESDKILLEELKQKMDNECSKVTEELSESSETSEDEEEIEMNEIEQPLSINCSSSNDIQISHSNDDCHDILTPQIISNNIDNKVLLSNLKEIHSVDSKSNMTSESGISFENNDPDSEDGYEEDSEDENVINNSNNDKTIKEPKIPQLSTFNENLQDNSNEIKVNVKGKISMFERAMSEEKVIERKDIPKVPSKYSFRHRESSEPPVKITLKNGKINRATSEIKEQTKNQALMDLINQRKSMPLVITNDENCDKKSVKDKISSYETNESDATERRENYRRFGHSKAKLSPLVRSIEESGEEDSGVTSDFCKQHSENETDSENFPELRKLSRYERASTHSRLYKLLQGDDDIPEQVTEQSQEEIPKEPVKIPYKSKKIIHNVSVTRRQNPQAATQAETMEERRQRLCLPLTHQSSSGAESMSSSTTPSPTPVNEKLVNELVQSLLSQKRGKMFRNLPIEKLHAAAVKILQEDMDSNATFSSADESTVPTVDSTPALTPQEFRNNSSYTEYYESWQMKDGNNFNDEFGDAQLQLIQSKAFKSLQEQQNNANKKLWSARCPRILSSKSINKDLARLSEVRESESPEPNHSRSPSIRSMSTEPMSGENRITNGTHQERQKVAANT